MIDGDTHEYRFLDPQLAHRFCPSRTSADLHTARAPGLLLVPRSDQLEGNREIGESTQIGAGHLAPDVSEFSGAPRHGACSLVLNSLNLDLPSIKQLELLRDDGIREIVKKEAPAVELPNQVTCVRVEYVPRDVERPPIRARDDVQTCYGGVRDDTEHHATRKGRRVR